jgi:hypothetical protein
MNEIPSSFILHPSSFVEGGMSAFDNSYDTQIYVAQGGAELHVGATGSIQVTAGGMLIPDSGVQPSDLGAFVDNTGGTPSLTFAAITAGASYAQADMVAVKNALSEIAAWLNGLRTAIRALGITA